MSEIGRLQSFSQRDAWLIRCDNCGCLDEISVSASSEATLSDLAENTYLQRCIKELRFLEELQLLVERHPNSMYPYKRMLEGAEWNFTEPEIVTPSDLPFEEGLIELLAKFGRNRRSFFRLKGRTETAHISIQQQADLVAKSFVACKACGKGRMHVQPEEFEILPREPHRASCQNTR